MQTRVPHLANRFRRKRKRLSRRAPHLLAIAGVLACAAIVAGFGAAAGEAPLVPQPNVASGGATTRAIAASNAFSAPARNLSPGLRRRFFAGNAIFNAEWAAPGSPDTHFVGLGPLFNASSCAACHVRDGRGQPPDRHDAAGTSGLLVRISVAGTDPHGGPRPHPAFGLQIDDRALEGTAPEGHIAVSYEEVPGRYGDGTPYSLRRPVYRFEPHDRAADIQTLLLSPRVAPAVFGMGLLEAIPEAAILARADPEDRDGDGISGRANRVWDASSGDIGLGRFGWKANTASLRDQVAAALLGDMGVASTTYTDGPSGGPEASDAQIGDLTFYMESVAVPARRDVDEPAVRRGAVLFAEIGCAACHVPALRTGAHPNAAVADQPIQPFTDLLLHDMGPGLADGRPDYLASGSEWRTPPLWGLGLIQTVNGHSFLLHDGRARGIAEAILWHGGEAEAAREAFRLLPAPRREDLLRFLASL